MTAPARLAVSEAADLWVYTLDDGSRSRITFDPEYDLSYLWSPDGTRVVFARQGSGLLWKNADGTGEAERLSTDFVPPLAWSPDGRTLIVGQACDGFTCGDIGMVSVDNPGAVTPLIDSPATEGHATLSPDGNWIAYHSDERGGTEVYVRPFPDVESGRWQVSNGGGESPLWSPNGGEIFYRHDDQLIAVSVDTIDTFTFGAGEVLFDKRPHATLLGVRDYSVLADGQRFLMVAADEAPSSLVVVRNWSEELKARVSTGQ